MEGVITEKGGQSVVRCAECQRFMYNQPQGGKPLPVYREATSVRELT